MTIDFKTLDAVRKYAKTMSYDFDELEEKAHVAIEKMVPGLKNNPLLQQYLQCRTYADGKSQFRNTLPWHAKAEQLYVQLLLMSINGTSLRLSRTISDAGRGSQAADGLSLAFMTKMAQPYLWSDAIDKLVNSSPPMPEMEITRDILPFPVIFWSYEVCRGNEHIDSNWLLMFDCADGITMVTDIQRGMDDIQIEATSIRYGAKFPQDFSEGIERTGVEMILKRLAFIASPCTIVEAARIPRPERRRMLRAGVPRREVDEVIHTVVLRREHAQAASEYEGATVERRHHWWVSGHFRKQWLPSTKSHRVVWIAPHVKGDLSKPLLEKVYTVIQ